MEIEEPVCDDENMMNNSTLTSNRNLHRPMWP